jgi:hypothetical protein
MSEDVVKDAEQLGEKLARTFLGLVQNSVEMDTDLPDGFWDDAFVLGFLGGCVLKSAPSKGLALLKPDLLLGVMSRVLANLSGREAAEMERRILELHDRDRDFRRGADNADKILSITWGLPGYDDDPDILDGHQRALDMREAGFFLDGEVSEQKALVAALQLSLFREVVFDRFGVVHSGHSIPTSGLWTRLHGNPDPAVDQPALAPAGFAPI